MLFGVVMLLLGMLATPVWAMTATLTAPANGARYAAPAAITLSAGMVVDSGFSPSYVDFYDGDTLLGRATSPFSLTVTGLQAKAYRFRAAATAHSATGGPRQANTQTIDVTVGASAGTLAALPGILDLILSDADGSGSTPVPPVPPVSLDDPAGMLPTGAAAGSLPGTFEVAASGAATYTIPLGLPSGSGGMQPTLGLAYSSQGGYSPLGMGWSLTGLSAVSRCPKSRFIDGEKGSVGHDANDRFCLDGQRLIAVSGSYGANGTEYRTQLESFSKIVSYGTLGSGPQYFRVWTKSGLIVDYGVTADSRLLANAAGKTEAVSWSQSSIADVRGNTISFVYRNSLAAGEQVPEEIRYVTNAGAGLTTPATVVRFEYVNRADPSVGYVAGSKFSGTLLLNRISITDSGSAVRSYRFAYATSQTSSRSLLASVQPCDGAGNCLPATTFDWQSQQAINRAFNGGGSGRWTAGLPWIEQGTMTVDVDGDGRTDFLRKSCPDGDCNNANWDVALSRGNQFERKTVPAVGYDGGQAYSLLFSDFNGDGRVDIGRRKVFLNGAADYGWDIALAGTDGSYSVQQWPASSSPFNKVVSADFNGDGRADYAEFVKQEDKTCPGNDPHNCVTTVTYKPTRICTNAGQRFDCAASNLTLKSPYGSQVPMDDAIPLDLDGDGLSDWLVYEDVAPPAGASGSFTRKWSVYRSTGSSFSLVGSYTTAAGSWVVPARDGLTPYRTWYPKPPKIADFNGDGLPDFMLETAETGSVQYCLNLGTRTAWPFSCSAFPANQVMAQGTVGDVNGDSLADGTYYLGNNQWGVCQKTDTGWSCNNWFMQPHKPDVHEAFGDFNGDGREDLAVYYDNGQWDIGIAAANGFDVVKRIRNGYGAETQIDYQPLTDSTVYQRSSQALSYPEREIVAPLPVVGTVSASDGLGGYATSRYRYQGYRTVADLAAGTAGYAGPVAPGFEAMWVTDERSGIEIETRFRRDWPYAGQVQVRYTRLAGKLLKDETNQLASLTGKTWFPYATSSTVRSYELNSSAATPITTVTTETRYDAYTGADACKTGIGVANCGNPTSVVVTTSGQGSDVHRTTTTSTYTDDTANWRLGRLRTATVKHESPGLDGGAVQVKTRLSSFDYYADGLLSKEIVEPGNPQYQLTTAYEYDKFGNRTKATASSAADSDVSPNVRTRSTSTAYDTQGRYPVSSTNALLQSEQKKDYLPGLGVFRTLVGPNNLSTVWTYDGFGQVIDELRADGTRTVSRVLRCDASCPANAAYYSASANSGSRVVSSVYFDVLNREIMRATTGFDGRRVLVKTRYNSKGQVEAKSKPHYEGEAEPGFDLVQIEYDGVARPKLTRRYATNKAGSRVLVTEYVVYDGLKTTSQNSEAQTRVETKNAAGQLKSVTDIGGRITTYDYDAMGALVRVTQPDGNKVVTGYDLLGRKTSNADPDAGTWTYVYNVLGQLTSQTDANQKTTTFKYDLLGRLTERSEVDLVSTWVFDKPADMHCATKGWIGALCYAKASNGMRRDVKYEAKGRVESVTTTIDRAYAIGTSYDNYGRVASISYPNAVVLNNVYDERGWLVEIRNGSKSVWKAEGSAAYDAAGRLRHERYGNGIVTDTGYDADTGFAVSIAAGNGVQYGISNQVYRIDTIGRLVKRDDFVTGLNESHEYDKFNRLWKTVSNFDATREITYDDNGNIRTKTGVGTYAYPAAGQPRPHGVTGIAGTVNGVVNPTFSYDANGNMLAGAGRSASWFSFNQPKTLASGTRSYTFLYDFDHQRVQETDSLGGRVTYTINPRLDLGHGYQRVVETAGTTEKVYVSVGGRNVALIETGLKSGTKWMHHDHLGSVIAVTDEAGAVVARYRYDPWGNQVRSAGSVDPTRRGYTGHEEIDGLGLVNMNGRVYDPVVARFLSVDPVLQDASNWQNYNRYSYVLNNPLMLTDPSGYSFMEKLGGVISGSYLNREILSHVSYETGSLLVTVGSMYCGPAYMACEAAGTYDNMRAHGYSARDSIQGGVQAGVMAVINNGIGQGTKGASVFGSDAYFANVTLHAIVGGMQAEMSGGDFKAGFLSAGISAAAAPAIDQIGSDNDGENWSNPMYKAERVATAAVIGGTVSVIAGGKFGNGALTAAFERAYNAESDKCNKCHSLSLTVGGAVSVVSGAEGSVGIYMSFEDMIIPTDFGYQASVGPTFGYTIGAGPMLTGTPGPTANIAGVTDNINFAGPVFSGTYASAPNMPKNTVAYAVGPKAALGAWVSRPTTYTLSLGGGLTSVLQAASGFFEQMYRGLMQYGPRYPQQHQ